MKRFAALAAAIIMATAGLAGCAFGEPSKKEQGEPPNLPRSSKRASSPLEDGVGVQDVATGLEAPWGLAFLPDGTGVVTERDSRRLLSVTPGGEVKTIQTITEADSRGEGGLLGVAVSPNYGTDQTLFLYYTTSDDNRIAKLQLGGKPEPIVTGIPVSGIHNGGRLGFGPDGYLYAGTGDAAATARSQDPDSLGGKILRMTADGQPAPGNPFENSLVYSLGHRNVQGFAWDAQNRMYATEFGQDTWDEVNLIEPGRNYGWPYAEGKAGDDRFVDPLVAWNPDEASPSGAAIVGDTLVVAALRGERLWLVPLNGTGGVGEAQQMFAGKYGRLRHAAAAPDGSLWILTSNRDGRGTPRDGDDRILRITAPGGSSVDLL